MSRPVPVSKPLVSLSSLRRELERGHGPISTLVPVTEGEESRAYGFHTEEGPFIVRLNRSAAGFEKDALAYRWFASPMLPIPEIVSLGTLDGCAYCVSRRAGTTTLQDLRGADLQRALAPVARVLDTIGSVELSGTSGYGPFGADGTGRFASWRAFVASIGELKCDEWPPSAPALDLARVEHLVELVLELAEKAPEVRQLVHGDFGSNNVLVADGEVSGVIDWSEALIGDPLYDVANILFWRPWLECMEQQAGFFEAERPDLLRPAALLRCYQLRIGLEQVFEAGWRGDERLANWAISRCVGIGQEK